MKGPILVSLKTLCKLYPLYTKSGSIWKNRVDWTKIEIPGMMIVTQFGIFTFVKAERIDKIWYWTLQSMDGKLYTIKRDQARKNKRMPKKIMRIVKIWKNVINKAKEYIDMLIDEMNQMAIKHNITQDNGDIIQYNANKTTFRDKLTFIYTIAAELGTLNRVYKKLAKEYHPDCNTKDTSNECKDIIKIYKLIKVCDEKYN